MSKKVSQRQKLLALHRRLYLLEVSEKKIDVAKRNELYDLLKKGDISREERDYLDSLVGDDDLEKVRSLENKCNDNGVRITTWYDDGYPRGLYDNKPPIMFVRGQLPDPVRSPHIAIVGSRKATKYGRELTDSIVKSLSPYDVTIVSGMAYGIDAVAHESALRYGLKTVAVLGCGINRPYPAAHIKLADKISKSGAVISEFPWGTPPLPFNFPMRNRVISGLSLALVVVEAEIRSGSLITARWAAEQGREVFAVPGDVGRALSTGTNLLIKEGAHLVETGRDIAETVGLIALKGEKEKNSGHLEGEDGIKGAIINYLRSGGNDLESLVSKTGLSVVELLPLITECEILPNLE